MTLSPPPGEPAAGPWRAVPLGEAVHVVTTAAGAPAGRPRVVAIDGRSGSGKSTLADRLHAAVPVSVVVHTDDVAWHQSFLDWVDLLATGVLEPVRRGQPVRYRPPAWDARGRPGAIEVAAGLDMVLVEGVGAGRRELAHLVDAVVWVQSDPAEAERRGLDRDVASGADGDRDQAAAFWREWMAEEVPFLEDQRPWERACVVVAGTPTVPHDPGQVVVAPPVPPGQPGSLPGEPRGSSVTD